MLVKHNAISGKVHLHFDADVYGLSQPDTYRLTVYVAGRVYDVAEVQHSDARQARLKLFSWVLNVLKRRGYLAWDNADIDRFLFC